MIFVDADACPVRAEVERVATRHGIRVAMVCNGGIRPSGNPLVETVYVSEGPDEADRWIATRAGLGDVVVTADVPLAARAVEAGARVLRPDGSELSAANVGNALATRDLMADIRAADPLHQGGGRSFGRAERSRFLASLERLVA
jgi:uncharacterized protein YaiI (UPF0178 family)